jgi:hypothetical protein
MSKARILPVLGLILLSVATILVTRSVLAGRQPRRAKVPRVAAAPRLRIVDESTPTLTIERARGGEGELEVSARASYRPIVGDRRVVWRLRVFRPTPGQGSGWGVAWQDLYDDRPLFAPKGHEARPAFSERLIMPPGEYTVEVGLGEVAGDRVDVVVTDLARITVR